MTTIDYFGEQELRQDNHWFHPDNYLDKGGMAYVYRKDGQTVAKVFPLTHLAVRRGGRTPGQAEVGYIGDGLIDVDGHVLPLTDKEQLRLQRAVTEYRLLEELREVSGVPHPKGYEFFRYQGLLYLALNMDFVAGQNLFDQCHSLSTRDAAKATADTVKTIQQFSHYGVVHGDLKPGNVMYAPKEQPGQGQTTVIDLGFSRKAPGYSYYQSSQLPDDLAQLLEEEPVEERNGSLLGTPGYFSPEQVRQEQLTPQSDVFSVGLMAFSLFTRREAFRGGYSEEDLLRHTTTMACYNSQMKRKLVARLSQHGLPTDLVKAIEIALDEVPQRRQLQPLQREAQRLAETSLDTVIESTPN